MADGDLSAEHLARRGLDRLGLAGDDGGRRPQRRRRREGGRVSVTQVLTRLDNAVDGATRRPLELQYPGGWWVVELESNSTMITEHLLWLHALGLRDPDTDRRLANDILAR